MTTTAYIAFGSNLGDRAAHLRRALREFAAHPGIEITAISPVYETAAHTLDDADIQPDFLNGVLQIRTNLSPAELLTVCHEVEAASGRKRKRRWAPRTLDLDLLMYGAEQLHTAHLILPHPRLAERRFVLQPLADLAPHLYIPEPFADTVTALLARCPDTEEPASVAISLMPGHPGS